jgi:hypothetical protein
VGCGSDSSKTPDASPKKDGAIDSPSQLMLTCASYCAGNLAACSGANSQWGSMQNCLDTCSHWTAGAITDTTGDTLGCRVYHTMAAQTAAQVHCVHSGPTGGTQCGANACADFCPLETAICPSQYPASGANSCATLCPGFMSTGQPYSSANTTGATIECRFYHLTAASTDPTTHCPHTVAITTGGPCS